MDKVSSHVRDLIEKMQLYFIAQPVNKVWLFGSCSRGEETPESDVDVLISFDKNQHVGLFTMGKIYMELKELLNHDIDLVEEGTLLPFAQDSANRDKILIYERAC